MRFRVSTANLVIFQYVIIYFQYFFQMILTNDTIKEIISLTSKCIIMAILFIYIKYYFSHSVLFGIGSYLIALIYICIQFLLFPQNIPMVVNMLGDFLFIGLINLNLFFNLHDFKRLLLGLYKIAFPALLLLCCSLYISIYIVHNNATYNITYSYMTVFMLLFALDSRKYYTLEVWHYIIILISIINILFYGSRGGLLCIGCYILLEVLTTKRKSKYFIIICLILGCLFYTTIFDALYQYLAEKGIYSRTIYLLSSSTIYLSGREIIQQNLINELSKRPIFGLGMGGDRIVNGNVGEYAHNILLEICTSFGIILGSIIIFLLLALIIWFFVKCKNMYLRRIGIVYFSYVIPMLMVSRSFWVEKEFWMLAGVLLCSIKVHKRGIDDV